ADRAMDDYNEALKLAPKNPIILGSRAQAYEKKGDYTSASADYEEAAKIAPKNSNALNNLAWFLATCPEAERRDGKRAGELAKKASELRKNKDPVIPDTLAAAYAGVGNFDEGVKWKKKAAELAPEGEKKSFQERIALYEQKKPSHQPNP